MITEAGFNLLHRAIKDNADRPQVLIGSRWRDGQIQKTEVSNESIKIYCYFDETIVGRITRYRLLGKDGNTFLEKRDTADKDDSRGLLTMFEIQIKEV